jgi:small subunit ribosomal protein S6
MSDSKGRSYDYEAMFLVSQSAAADLGSIVDHINEILAKGSAELIALRKWDERRLAFEISKQKRGTYLLAYFSADPANIMTIERACNLSETVLRFMLLRADHLTREEMTAADAREELKTEIELRKAKADEAETAAATA